MSPTGQTWLNSIQQENLDTIHSGGFQEYRLEQRKVEDEDFEDKWRKTAHASCQNYESWLKLNSKENL